MSRRAIDGPANPAAVAAVRDEIMRIFVTVPDDEMYAEVLDVLLRATDSAYGVFSYLDEDGVVVCPSMTRDVWDQCKVPDKSIRFPPETWGETLWGRAIREKRTLIRNVPSRVPEGHVPIDTVLIVPILYRGEVIGHFELANRPGGYHQPQVALCEAISEHVAPVLQARSAHDRHRRAQRQAEAEQRITEARYEAFLAATADMAYVKDADYRYVMVNAAYADFFGLPVADILGKTDFDLMEVEAAKVCRNTDAHALTTGAMTINNEIIGGHIYETRKFPVPLSDGTGVGGVIRDISEQTLAQQEVRRNETRLRSMVRILQYRAATVQGFLDFVLDEAIGLTESKLGYIFFYDEASQIFRLNSWSEGVLGACDVSDAEDVYELEKTGVWGEVVRQRRSVIVNDFAAPHPKKKGVPEGHAPLTSFMTVPVFSDGRIVAVVGVANKPADYTDGDVLQLTLLMDAAWQVVQRKRAEEALQREKDNLSSILAAAPVPTMVFDHRQVLVMANPAAERMFGAPLAELLGERCGDLLICEHRVEEEAGCGHSASCAACSLNRALVAVLEGEAQGDVEGETHVALEGAGGKWLSYRVNPVLLDNKRQAVMALDDITDRKQAQDALAAERRLLRTVIDNLPDAIYVKDLQGRKTLANPADLHNIGVETEDEVLGKTDADLFPESTAARFSMNDRRVLEDGEPFRDHEEYLVNRAGRQLWLRTSKFPLRDEDGKVIGLVGTGRDVTEQKRAESERRELLAQVETQARQLQQIIETVPQGVLLLDSHGRVLMTNPLADDDLSVLASGRGNRITHLGGRPLDELLAPPPAGLWHEVEVAQDGRQRRVYEMIARPVSGVGSDGAWVMVINEATEERQVRDQLQRQERLAAVGQLAAGIAHDFNNIMAVIVLHVQLISRSQSLSGRNRERLETIHGQAHYATKLIDQILDFSRRSVLARQTLDLHPLVKEEVKLLRRTLPENIKVDLVVDDEDLAEMEGVHTVSADPTRIQQLLMNLAINARDAMPNGGRLTLRLGHQTLEAGETGPIRGMRAGSWVVLSVRDTGSGIPTDVLPHIFEPFFTTKEAGLGSGLGLAQVHGIVGQHGGYIDVDTTVGVGTTFTIYLPAVAMTEENGAVDLGGALPTGRGQTVLVVEDSIPLRDALQEMLMGWEYEVYGAEDGAAALALLETLDKPVDLILSDVVMPEMGGQALVRELRARGLHMPVILMSGHPQDQGLERLHELGVHAWLHKPPDLDLLATTLAAALA